jgi:hypothetical protein
VSVRTSRSAGMVNPSAPKGGPDLARPPGRAAGPVGALGAGRRLPVRRVHGRP